MEIIKLSEYANIYSFNVRMYGLRKSKRKTEKIIKCLQEKDANND